MQTLKIPDGGVLWEKLAKEVTYQIHTPSGWLNITRQGYATIQNPQNRRILLKPEQTIINSELIKI